MSVSILPHLVVPCGRLVDVAAPGLDGSGQPGTAMTAKVHEPQVEPTAGVRIPATTMGFYSHRQIVPGLEEGKCSS
jgi:hypothetical protein